MNYEDLKQHNLSMQAEFGHHNIRKRIHECDVCGHKDYWGDTWAYWGSIASEEDGKVLKFCSAKCRAEGDVDAIWRKKFGVRPKKNHRTRSVR